MSLCSITEVKNLYAQRILLRVDFNIPIQKGKILDDYKIKKSLPTLKFLMKQGAKIIVVSHLGRPQGKLDASLSLRPICTYLENVVHKKIMFVDKTSLSNIGKDVILKSKLLHPGDILFLENIRFFKEEEDNTRGFPKKLAQLADAFVLDGFGVAHRNAASVTGVAEYIPSYAGLLLIEEVTALSRVIISPQRPVVAILGGIKLETKIPVIDYLLPRVDTILVGGGIATTYLWAQGYSVGNSIVEKKFKKKMLEYARNKKIIAPHDVLVGTKKGIKVNKVIPSSDTTVASREGILDIGPQTLRRFREYIHNARTVVWNGALGYFENPFFAQGTFSVARAIARNIEAYTVCGGGETIQALQRLKLTSKVTVASTGGGAMLEFLSGKPLPGLQALQNFN